MAILEPTADAASGRKSSAEPVLLLMSLDEAGGESPVHGGQVVGIMVQACTRRPFGFM